MKLAARHDLEMVEMVNLASYYQDNNVYFQRLLKEYSVLKDTSDGLHMSDKVMELVGLFTTFVFRKVEPKL